MRITELSDERLLQKVTSNRATGARRALSPWASIPVSSLLLAALVSSPGAQAAEIPSAPEGASLQVGHPPLTNDCEPVNGAEFICGVDNVEDFVRLPDGRLIGSDLAAAGNQGHFFLFDLDRSVHKITPEEIAIAPDPAHADCPGAPDWTLFTPHGMDLVADGDGATLYAANHGGRDVVEIFDVDLSAGDPELTWTGCLVPPEGTWPDDVAVLPTGGLLVSSLWDPRDEARLQKLINGAPVGELLEWHADTGWSTVPGTEKLSGPNGIIVTPDGLTAYLAAWSGQQLATIDRTTGAISTIDLDYTPDNLTWAADGRTFFIGGTTANVEVALDCFGSTNVNCPWTGVRVDRFDPASLELETLIEGDEFGEFGMATGAIDVGDELWVNSYRSDRVAVFQLKCLDRVRGSTGTS